MTQTLMPQATLKQTNPQPDGSAEARSQARLILKFAQAELGERRRQAAEASDRRYHAIQAARKAGLRDTEIATTLGVSKQLINLIPKPR